MNWFFFIVILLILLDVEDKLNKLKQDKKIEKKLYLDLQQYKNKSVSITINNDNLEDSYLFSSISNTTGKIVGYDKEWFVFSYYNKNTNTQTEQYLRIRDIESINEVNTK